MLGNKKLGKVTFNLDVNSSHYENQYPSVLLKGLVAVSYTHLNPLLAETPPATATSFILYYLAAESKETRS